MFTPFMVTYPSFSKYTHLISYHYKTGHIIDRFTSLTYLLVFFFYSFMCFCF